MNFILLTITSLLLTGVASAAVVKSNDAENHCSLYQVVQEDDQGRIVLSPGQQLVSHKRVYGLSFKGLEIDFDRREVRVQPMINVILNFNTVLIPNKAIIRENNPEFTFLVNQLNRKLALFEKICISPADEIIYAKYFPAPEESSNHHRR